MDVECDPIDILVKEHERGLSHARLLGEVADYVEVNGFSIEGFNRIAELVEVISTEILEHHRKEEKYLFPLLGRHVDGPPQMMEDEHRQLRKAFHALKECVRDVEELRISASTVPDLIRCSREIVRLLEGHIGRENTIIFPMAKSLLTTGEYEELRRRMSSDVREGQEGTSR